MSILSKPFGHYLKAKRTMLGLSQADLADKSKVQRTSISRLESISGNPQWSMIRVLAEEGMGISVPEFFQVDPIEARQPIISVGTDAPAPRLAELMLKTQGKAIPVINDITPLRSKIITDKDIIGYSVIDHGLLKDYMDKKLVIWMSGDEAGTLRWLVADIQDTRITNRGIFLVVLNDEVEARQSWLSPAGALILEPTEGDDVAPVAFWGRQKDRVEVLGRVVMSAKTHRR